MNKEMVKRSFSRCLGTYNQQAIVQEDICDRLVQHCLKLKMPKRAKIFEIGCGTGLLTHKLSVAFDWERFWANDLVPEVEPMLQDFGILSNKQWEFIGGDVESIEFPKRLDLVISGSTFQWIADLDRLFAKISNALAPGGYLIFNTFGKDNLREIRSLTQNGLNYHSLNEIKSKLSRYFKVDVATEEQKRLVFSSPRDVLSHLRETGVNGLSRNRWTKRDYIDFKNRYIQNFSTLEGVTLCYHSIMFVSYKTLKHKSPALPDNQTNYNPLEIQF